MPHSAKPWFRPSRNLWYVELHGKQQPLGKHPEGLPLPKKGKSGWNPPAEILGAYHKLMADTPTAPAAQRQRGCHLRPLSGLGTDPHVIFPRVDAPTWGPVE